MESTQQSLALVCTQTRGCGVTQNMAHSRPVNKFIGELAVLGLHTACESAAEWTGYSPSQLHALNMLNAVSVTPRRHPVAFRFSQECLLQCSRASRFPPPTVFDALFSEN